MEVTLESYFTRENIIKLLCKYRIKAAKKKHSLQLIRDISASEKSLRDLNKEHNNCPVELSKLLPPRRKWIRPNKDTRKLEKYKNSQKIIEYSITRKILSTERDVLEAKILPPVWYNELNCFIEKIQTRIITPSLFIIEKPDVKPIKKENKKSCTECRPISINNIEDRIIISLTAKYFIELFDDSFLESSFAFRASKKGEPVRTHHSTIEKIKTYLKKNQHKEIFVAEADIAKFFDCVNHDLTIHTLYALATKYKLKLNESAVVIFKQYLDSYSFNNDVYTKNGTIYFDNFNIPNGEFVWKKEQLLEEYYDVNIHGENLENINIGVPQGGAISCFISNLLLHCVDEVLENKDDSDLLYLRFCDDMVLLHTDKAKCQEYLNIYQTGVENLKLLVHPPKIITSYDEHFWGTKSKAPYKWGDNNVDKVNVPWLSFVGYQIRYDGIIRLRKKSLEKELSKQHDECKIILQALLIKNQKGVFKHINHVSKKSKRQQLYALENRLISMAVGRVLLYKLDANQTQCWTNGFKALSKNKVVIKQMKMLDSNRTKQLYKFKNKICLLNKKTTDEDEVPQGRKIKFGGPYSYYGFLNRRK